ncbi:MAG: hypothetical protein NTZ78_13945 [Candidatus Aureabacteria bacterium]|nr:hypothetical protein [Candidatus Auribacterota bacterium]
MRTYIVVAAAVALCFATTCSFAQTYTVLHNFAGGLTDGEYPAGGVVSDGSKIYGITYDGGASDDGVLYSMNMDGSGFTLLHSFGPEPDGTEPNGGLALDNGVLYGTTDSGGANSEGTLYSIKTDGSAYTILYSFASGTSWYPSPVVVSGGMIYGLTENGGTTDDGIAYSIKTDGTGYTVTHNFADTPLDGSEPWGGLLLEDGTLYGATRYGGKYILDAGTLFSMSTAGSDQAILHDFSGPDGALPVGGLISDGNRLYGLTMSGGAHYGPYDYTGGTIFAVDKNGANFQTLHDYTLNTAAETYGSKKTSISSLCTGLARDGNKLYGTTSSYATMSMAMSLKIPGGWMDPGGIFTINTDGSGYTVIYSFDGIYGGSGTGPIGTPLLSNGTLYGAARYGGTENRGVVYSFVIPPIPTPTPTPSFFVPFNVRLGNAVQPPAGTLTIFADATVEGTIYAGVPCRPYIAVSVGGTLYYVMYGNKLTTTMTPYVNNGKKKYFQLYEDITNFYVAYIPFSGLAPGDYWVYGALLNEEGAPMGPIAKTLFTIK